MDTKVDMNTQGNTNEDLERAYKIELDRIEQSIGKKLTQEVYDNELFKINEDDFYTITFIRQAADSALEDMCSIEVDDNQTGYALFIGGKCYGLFDTMILAQAASRGLLGDSTNTFKVPIFSSIIPLMHTDEDTDDCMNRHMDEHMDEHADEDSE